MEVRRDEMLHSLYNTQINGKRAVGYCWKHHCFVSTTQLKQKECLKKQCNALEKCEHEFWRQRDLKKARKKERVVVY